ncbi:MAG: insulinase family protein [Bacteroidota bacterium]
MKKLPLYLLLLGLPVLLFGQSNATLQVESYQLPNGLTVFLNNDPTATKVYGAVMVNAGAKHEDPTATGMAHYLEHILFKGTDELGTADFQKEKPHLDSINILYEALAKANSDEAKQRIQKQINKQALKASQYGLPNEFDRLLKSIGSTGVNAFTNYEMTFYHNSFPAHEMSKWLNIYATRFKKPVFRSFQSELEVVYEEKNRALDNFQRKIGEKLFEYMFPNLPYGQWSVLGTVEHLKTPSLIKMYEFYNKHYIANNMALILSGKFDVDHAKEAITLNFSDLASGSIPKLDLPQLEGFDGVQKYNARMTPVKVGFTGFQTVGSTHPDRPALDVYEYMLSNNSQTGLIDQISQRNELMYAGTIPVTYKDAGGYAFFYVPKILVQSLGGAEKKFLNVIEAVNAGDFDEQLFTIAKNELQTSFKERLDNVVNRGQMIGEAFNRGLTWEAYLGYPQKIASVTKEDLIRVGKQYFGPDRMKFISRTGFPKKNKLKKPPYKPIVTDQKESSVYAKKFEKIPALPFNPRFIDFEKDLDKRELPGGHDLFVSKNQSNDLFYLTLKFKIGSLTDQKIPNLAGILNQAGAGTYDRLSFKKRLAVAGIKYNVWSDNNYVTFRMTGLESSLDQGLEMLNLLMTDPKITEEARKAYISQLFGDRKLQENDPNFMSRALFDYGLYGARSPEKRRASAKEIKSMDIEVFASRAKEITSSYSANIIYHGNMTSLDVSDKLRQYLNLTTSGQAEKYSFQEATTLAKNKIYVVHDKKAVQSQVYFYIRGDEFKREDYAVNNAFNQYFSGGFSGLVLQEIREYRSLAYSASARYNEPLVAGEDGRLYAFIGCQSDKTNDAIAVMTDLLGDLPARPERMPSLKKALQLQVVTDFPEPDNLAYEVIDLENKGYTTDPNREAYSQYTKIDMEDITAHWASQIKGRPLMITIYGDKRNIDLDALRKIGEVVELKKGEVATF